MIKRGLSFGGLLLALAAPAAGQTIAGDRFTLNTGPCTIRSGAGAPEGVVTGKVCDIYIRTDGGGVGIVYVKDQGTSSAGWVTLTPGIPLDATPGKVLVSGNPVSWSDAPSLRQIGSSGDLAILPAGSLNVAPAGGIGLFTGSGGIMTDPGDGFIYPRFGFKTTIGRINQKYLALHAAELWVETLVAQQTLATIGGRVVVAPTNILARDFPATGNQFQGMCVKYPSFQLHIPGVELGSKVFLESAGKFEIVSVIDASAPAPAADGAYCYTVQRNDDGSGQNDWFAGDAMLDTGTAGRLSGMIDLYAVRGLVSGAGPAIVGSIRGSTAPTDLRPRFAIGNLNGVGYGHNSDVYGFAAGDPAGPNFFVDAVNGLHLRQGTTPYISLRPNGTVTITGDGSGVTNINGGNLQADTITSRELASGSVTADTVSVGAITADKIAAGAVSAGKLSVGTGSNFLRNSECRTGTAEWGHVDNTGVAMFFGSNYHPSYALNGEPSVCYYTTGLTPPNGTGSWVFGKTYPAQAGLRYEGSVYAGAHRAGVAVAMQFLRADGGGLAEAYGSSCPAGDQPGGAYGGASLAMYCRLGVFGTAPAGTTGVRLFVYSSYTGLPNPYVFFVRAYLGEAKVNQTELSEWSPAGLTEIDGGLITTGAIRAVHIAAGAITADKIAARSITADRIGVGVLTSTELAARSITADRIGVGVLTSTEIAARSIGADRIVAGAITGTEIAAGTISSGHISVGSLSAISATLGSVSAGTITGSTIYGSTIYAGSGNEILLTNSGMYFSGGNGSNPAKIDMDRAVIWGNNATLRFDGTDFTFNGNLHANNIDTGGGVTGLDVVANRTMYSVGMVNGDGIVSRNMPTWGGNVRAVYYNFGEQRFGFWTGAATSRANVQAWDPPDPLAILRAPIVSFASGTERELGFSVEGLAALLPDLVMRDGAGRPDQIRTEAVVAALLKAIAELERRIKVLEAKGGGL